MPTNPLASPWDHGKYERTGPDAWDPPYAFYEEDNDVLTEDQKAYVEHWYWLPINVSKLVFAGACVAWSMGWINGVVAYLIGASAVLAVAWITHLSYSVIAGKVITFLVGVPYTCSLLCFAVGGWLLWTGHYWAGGFLIANTVTIGMLIAIPTIPLSPRSQHAMHENWRFAQEHLGVTPPGWSREAEEIHRQILKGQWTGEMPPASDREATSSSVRNG